MVREVSDVDVVVAVKVTHLPSNTRAGETDEKVLEVRNVNCSHTIRVPKLAVQAIRIAASEGSVGIVRIAATVSVMGAR